MSLLSVVRQKLLEHRFIVLGVFFLTLSLFLVGTKNISAQTSDIDTNPKTCTPKPACMFEFPACAVDPAPGFTGWCPDASPSPSASPSSCQARPTCLDAAKPCDIREPVGGWCPASPAPSATPNTCSADLNKDGFIDLIDYGLFVPHFLETTASSKNDAPIVGDFNGDGIVDLLDYSEIVRMFLKSCPISGNTGKLGSPQPLGSPGIEVQPTASPDNILPIN